MLQGIWSWLGNRTSLKGKLCIETNGIADPCLFVCLFGGFAYSHFPPIPNRFHQGIDFHPQILTRSMTFEVDQPDLLEENITKSSFYKSPIFVGGFSTHSLLISTFSTFGWTWMGGKIPRPIGGKDVHYGMDRLAADWWKGCFGRGLHIIAIRIALRM